MARRSTRRACHARNAKELADSTTSSSRISKRYSQRRSENIAPLSIRNCWQNILNKRNKSKQKLSTLVSFAMVAIKTQSLALDISVQSEVTMIYARNASRSFSPFHTQCSRSEISNWLLSNSFANMTIRQPNLNQLHRLPQRSHSLSSPLSSLRPNALFNQKLTSSPSKQEKNFPLPGSSKTAARWNGHKLSASRESKATIKWFQHHGKLKDHL